MGVLTLDTCFLIDHQREVLKKMPGPAHQFSARHAADVFAVSVVAWGEFLAGFPPGENATVSAVRRHLRLLPVSEAASILYGRIFQDLKREGRLIGANDLWIAAVAMAEKLPLVTRNGSEFGRINDLQVLEY